MKPSEELNNEHRVIGKALSTLRAIARSVRENQDVSTTLLDHQLEFIRGFTEECHHRKEEEVLFPALAEQLKTAPVDPLPEFIREHIRIRNLMDELREAVGAYAAGETANNGDKLAALADEYADLSIEHMRKENVILINLIENTLPADKKLEVAERFLVIEDELGPGYRERYEELADNLRDEGRRMAA